MVQAANNIRKKKIKATSKAIVETQESPKSDAHGLTAGNSATEVPATGKNHPLAHLAGKYADEPLWDDFMAAIEDYRRKQNELEDIVE